MSIKILKKNDKNILKLKKAENGVEYFSFEALEKYTELINGFSTRIGGVSEGPYASMNLSLIIKRVCLKIIKEWQKPLA